MRQILAVTLLATAIGCTEPTAPLITPALALAAREDSLSKGAMISWTEGDQAYFVSFAEGHLNHTRTAIVSYSLFDTYPCDDGNGGTTTCYDLVSYGFGEVPRADVRGGGGALRVQTNTSPASNPGFEHFNDPGGVVAITLHQVPNTAFRMHEVGSWEWGGAIFGYNTQMEMRAATVSGEVVGWTIPATAEAWLTLSWGHTTIKIKE